MNIKDIINEELFSNEEEYFSSEDYFSDESIKVGTTSYCHIPIVDFSQKTDFSHKITYYI